MKKVLLVAMVVFFASCNDIQKPTVDEKPIDSIAAMKISCELDSIIAAKKIKLDDFGLIESIDGPDEELFDDLAKRAYKTNDTVLFKKAIEYSTGVKVYNVIHTQDAKKQETKPLRKPSEWEVKPGCTREYVLDAWGKPDHIATSETSSYKCEMFYYYKRNTIVTIFDGWVEEVSSYK